MIKESIEYIAKKLQDLNLFEKVYSQVEIVSDAEGKSYPAVYSSNGKYEIIQYSLNNGTAYIRKDGNLTLAETNEETYIGCASYYLISIPLIVVAFKKKSKLPIDCSYSEDIFAETLFWQLTNNVSDYSSTINAKRFKIIINNINTNSADVWSNETEKIDQVDINYDIACIALNIEIQLLVDTKCLSNMCNNNIPN